MLICVNVYVVTNYISDFTFSNLNNFLEYSGHEEDIHGFHFDLWILLHSI